MNKIAILGNFLPRRCGIATFTADLATALSATGSQSLVVAMNDTSDGYDYPEVVRFEIDQNDPDAYLRAADFLNASGADVLSLQHEFGIFGGPAGSHVLKLLRRLQLPVVTTLHTVLERPNAEQRRVAAELIERSQRLVVMSRRGRHFLHTVYGVAADKIDLIEHGIPDVPFLDTSFHKDHFGLAGKSVMLTFGLLSQNKGVETAIRALPDIMRAHPDVVYVVLGATHPHVLRLEGESYRDRLRALAEDLGVGGQVRFEDRFVDPEELVRYMGVADLYLTPYLNREQIVSGTLAYAVGMGKAVISTPYWYAEELLAEGRGLLVPFGDAGAIAEAAIGLLEDAARRDAMRKQAYLYGRGMTWARAAESYLSSLERASGQFRPVPLPLPADPLQVEELPPFRLDHVLAMTDDTGMLQHAAYQVPNYREGYTTDDNARALTVACLARALRLAPARSLRPLAARYLAFLHYALDAETGRFRNFLGYDRRWLEATGSENSHGRALRALATFMRHEEDEDLFRLAHQLFEAALPAARSFTSPRAWALTLLGLAEYLEHFYGDRAARRLADELAARLLALYHANRRQGWLWFEDHLCHSNAKLAQALLRYGGLASAPQALEVGLDALEWLTTIQTSDEGFFAPVGSARVYRRGQAKPAFDQQPIEAYATVSACLEAYRVSGRDRWHREAKRTFDWFLGHNQLGLPLYDPSTGGCRDGLHENRVNRNQGAESTLACLLAQLELRQALSPQAIAAPAAG